MSLRLDHTTPDKAVDGYSETEVNKHRCALTGSEIYSWWKVDLSKEREIYGIAVVNRKHHCSVFNVFNIEIGLNCSNLFSCILTFSL